MYTEGASIWKDRKRYFGLPLSFTRYEITNDRILVSVGFFHTVEDELLLYRILDIKLIRNIFNKIFGVGTICLYCADETNRCLYIKNIKNPREVRNLISSLAEEARAKIGIRGREIIGTGNDSPLNG